MVWNEIDDHPEPVPLAAVQQRLEFLHALVRIRRVIRADIEVVLDRIRTAREPLENVRIICGAVRIRRAARLLEHAGQPEVGKTHFLERVQRRRVDVVKLAASVLLDRAVGLAGLVGVPECPDHQLVDHGTGRVLCAAGQTHHRQ